MPDRGLFTGNRGCVVDDDEMVVRHHRGDLWIICVTEFRDRRVALARPNRWTPLFFLDDVVALAAGHRPCGACRHDAYVSYRDAVTAGLHRSDPVRAGELNRMLRAERLHGRAREIDRADHRIPWSESAAELPDGTVVVIDGLPHLFHDGDVRPFSFAGWGAARTPPDDPLTVLTPPTSVLALAHGFAPTMHPSASG